MAWKVWFGAGMGGTHCLDTHGGRAVVDNVFRFRSRAWLGTQTWWQVGRYQGLGRGIS